MDDTEITDEADGPYDDSTDSSELGEPLDYEDGDEQVDRSSDEPDVFLDVRQLRVDEITLDVEDLQARVSLQAEVLDLLKLNVGVEAELGSVHLEIRGVEAQALLKVRLDNVARIIGRVLTTIDRHPEIVEQLAAGVGSAADELGRGAGDAVGELGRGAGEVVEDVDQYAGEAIGDIGDLDDPMADEDGVSKPPRRPLRRRDQGRRRERQGP
jgi:hypothetical protein